MRLSWIKPEDLDMIGEFISAKFPELTATAMYSPHAAVAFVDDTGEMRGALCLRMASRFEGTLSIYTDQGYFPDSAMLTDLFTRAFGFLGLKRLSCRIARSNMRARKLVEHLGFKLEGTLPRGFDGTQTACLYGMVAERCPWRAHDGRA